MKAFSGKQFAIIGADNIGRILLERPRQSGVPAEQLSLCDSAAEHATMWVGA
jgi:pyrroline-5-carboxylate reductase